MGRYARSEVEPVLAALLASEADPRVIRDLCLSLTRVCDEPPAAPPAAETSAAAIGALTRAADSGLRVMLVDLIGRAVATQPPARVALVQLFASDKTPQVREAIGKYLSATDLSAP